MKRLKRYLPLTLFIGILISTFSFLVQGSWQTPGEKENDVAYSETGSFDGVVSDPVCYINNTNNVYPSIEGALAHAIKDDFVVVLPPTDSITFPTDSNDSRTNKTTFSQNDTGLVVKKVTYTIKSPCTVPEGVTLILPYETVSSSMISTQNNFNNNYLSPMKKGTHESKGDSIFYKYTNGTKGGELINFNAKYATDNSNMFLRTTIEVADGVQITNKGTIVISGILSGGSGSGGLAGQTSHFYTKMIMGAGSKIVQDSSSAKIYCFGYIEEKVENNNSLIDIQNGSIYIPFVINDCPEAYSTVALAKNGIYDYRVAPFNQFEVRNVEPKLSIQYNGKLIALENLLVYVNTSLMSINKENPNDISMISNSNSSFLQFNTSYSYVEFKYSKSNKLNDCHFYGGFDINSLSITVEPVSGSPMTVSFDDAVFPIPYQLKITLSKANSQPSQATYNCNSQQMKCLPGTQLILENGVRVNASFLAIYSAFFNKNAIASVNDVQRFSAINYPVKDGAICKVYGTSILNVTTIGGTVYANSDDNITSTNNSLSLYEGYWLTSNPVPYARKFSTPLVIREKLQRYSITDFSKNKLFVGVNSLSNQNSYLAGYNVVLNDENETTTSVENGYQKVILYDNQLSFKIGLVRNINTIYYRKGTSDTFYPKNNWINFSDSHHVDVIPSSLAISGDEFDITSINLHASSDPIEFDGVYKQGVLLDQSEAITADIVDYSKIYNRTVTFESSDPTVLKISDIRGNVCTVTGLKLGDAKITATCDGMSDSLDFKVVNSLQNLVAIDSSSSGTYISNGSSKYRNQTKHTHEYGNGKNCNSTPDFTSSVGSNQYTTFTLHVVPSNADIQTVTWKFSGDPSYVSLVNSNKEVVSTLSNVYSVEVLQKDTSANYLPDSSCLECTILDKLDNTMTIYICIKSSLYVAPSCLLPDTLITMADGSKKPVKDVKSGDLVRVFNHETGKIDIAPITFNDYESAAHVNVINLEFSNGKSVGVVSEHGFFDLDTMRYEYIDEHNYQEFIGHRFYSETGEAITLDNAYVDTKYTEVYSPTSFFHLDYFTEGVLSMPGGITGLFNIFEYGDNLQYEPEAYARDIETYGLFTYEDLAPLGVTEIMFEAYAGKYLKVALGKGILTEDYLAYLIERYGGFTE